MSTEKYTGAGGILLPSEEYPAKITKGYYRVREESDEQSVELGAYRLLVNAIRTCDEHPGSCVYADAGVRIYPADSGEPGGDTTGGDNTSGENPDPTPGETTDPENPGDNTGEPENPGETTDPENSGGDPENPGETTDPENPDNTGEPETPPTEPDPPTDPETPPKGGDKDPETPSEPTDPEDTTIVGYAKLKTLMNIRTAPGGDQVTTYRAKTIVPVLEFGSDGWLKIVCPESETGIAYVSNENGAYAFTGSSVYTVQQGDTVWKIAETQLGDGTRGGEISTLNSLVSNRIQIGMELLLP